MSLSTNNIAYPSGNPKLPLAKKFEVNFTSNQLSQSLLIGGQNIGDTITPQSAIVDNTLNQFPVILTIDSVNYPVPAYGSFTFPVISSEFPRASIVSQGEGQTTIILTNQRLPASTPNGGNVKNVPIPNIQTMNDYSGTIATASTSQQAVAAGDITQFLLIQNLGSTPLYVNFGAAATAGEGSIAIAENDSLIFKPDFVPSGSINVLSATASAPYTIKGF